MDEVIHVEIIGRHGEVVARHAGLRLPVKIGRAYDNDVILDDPYVAPCHAVLERSVAGELELVDAGSKNGLFRVGAAQRLTRERIDPCARYRAGRTAFRIRSPRYPVGPELVDPERGRLAQPVVACLAVLAAAAMLLLSVWSETSEQTEFAKLARAPVLLMVALFVWSGAWDLAGRLLVGERRFSAHLAAAALTVIGACFIAGSWDYVAFAVSAPGFESVALVTAGASLAWGLWRHLALVTRNPGRGVALAAIAVTVVAIGSLKLYFLADSADDLTKMTYLKAVKPPVVRLANGREAGEFFQDAARLKSDLESLTAK